MDPGYADSGARRFFAELKTWLGSSYRGFRAALAGLPKRTQRFGSNNETRLSRTRIDSAVDACRVGGVCPERDRRMKRTERFCQRHKTRMGELPWHSAPRRWGHSLHSLCSYMAMFPPSMPHFFIRWLTKPGDVVYDPFSGRGTTVLEAGLLGRAAFGSDANPMAWTLTAAKASPPSAERLQQRLSELKRGMRLRSTAHVPDHVRILFHPSTLSQLVWLQDRMSLLRGDDRFIYAVLLGILHANARVDGTPRGLTVAMPNTFAMAPNYVKNYVRRHKLKAREVDVVSAVADRVARLEMPPTNFRRGRSWMQDIRKPIRWPEGSPKAKLIFASPPYLQVMKYGKLNWIRLWLLGHEPRSVDSRLFTSGSLPKYLEFMSDAIARMKQRMRSDGYICLVIGDVSRKESTVNLAGEVAEHCVQKSGLRVIDVLDDDLPADHKVSRIWGERRGRATKTDRILILGGARARSLPPVPRIDWSSSSCYGG